MTEKEKKAAKDRILKSAVSLFAARGYDAVGVREIAQKANVNISMISYYFNGKIGILTAIFTDFHDQYESRIMRAIDPKRPIEKNIETIIYNLIDFVKENTDLAMVVFNTTPFDIPEINQIKIERVNKLFSMLGGLLTSLGVDPGNNMILSIIGPGLYSFIITHFRLQSLKSKILHIPFDEAFFDDYKEIISTLFLKGIRGVTSIKKYQLEK